MTRNCVICGQEHTGRRQTCSPVCGRVLRAQRGRDRWNRPGERQKLSERNRQQWADPEQRASRQAAIAAACQSPEMRAHFSSVHKDRWRERPKFRARNDKGKFLPKPELAMEPPATAARKTEQDAIAAFLKTKGVTRLPGVGDDALIAMSESRPLVWDRKKRVMTRRAVAPDPVRYRRPPA